MVLLVAKINKLYSKLENNVDHHIHNQSEAVLLSASLERFFSDVFNDLSNKLSSSSSEIIMSFSCIQKIFELIPITNKAFAKLVVEIDYPMSKWKSDSVDQFLNYTLTLLDLFNSITYSLSNLSQARVSLSHALSLKEEKKKTIASSALKHLKRIEPFSLSKINRAIVRERKLGEEVTMKGLDKEEAIRRALSVMESLGFWACGVVLSSLSGDEFVLKSSVERLDSRLFEGMVEKKVEIVKEVREVNESVDHLLAAIGDGKFGTDEAEELSIRLGVFERKMDGFGSEIDGLFKELLRRRNQLLSGFQVNKRKA